MAPSSEPITFWRSREWWRLVTHASAASWIGQVAIVLGSIIAARGLGPDRYGSFVVTLSACSLLALFVDFTLEEALVYYGIRDRTLHEGAHLRRLFAMAAKIDVALGIAVFGLLWLGASHISSLATGGTVEPGLIRIGALTVLAATVDGTTGAALLVVQRPDLRVRGAIVANFARLGLLMLAVPHGAAAALGAVAIAMALGAIAQSAMAWRAAWRSWPTTTEHTSTEIRPRSILLFGAQSSFTSSLAAATVSVVPIVLGRALGPTAVANFSVASAPLAAAGILTAPIRLAVLPEQTALWARGRRRDLRHSVLVLGGAVVVLTIPVIGIGWIALPWLLPLVYGQQFGGAIPVSRILLFALLGLMPTSWLKLVAVASGRPARRTAVGALDLAVTATAVGLLSAIVGLSGAAFGFVGASLAVAAAWLVSTARSLPNKPDSTAGGAN